MPVLHQISFEDKIVRKTPSFKRLTFEQYHRPVRFKMKGMSIELFPVIFTLKVLYNGLPVEGALCEVWINDEIFVSATTGLSGIVALDYLLGENCLLKITAEGYQTHRAAFYFENFKSIDWEITLNKEVTNLHDTAGNSYIPAQPSEPGNDLIL